MHFISGFTKIKVGELPLATYCDVLPQLIHNLLGYRIQHTTYLSPSRVLSRTSRLLGITHYRLPKNRLYCVTALTSYGSDHNATLSDTSSMSGYVTRDSTTCFFFTDLRYPYGRLSRCSFRYLIFAVTSTRL